jgi:IS4 transposase
MKQTLKITRFVGRSENAVRVQIAVALIAFLLLRALQQIAKEPAASSNSFYSCAPTSCTEKTR